MHERLNTPVEPIEIQNVDQWAFPGWGDSISAPELFNRHYIQELREGLSETLSNYPDLRVIELVKACAQLYPNTYEERPNAVRGLLNIPESAIRLAGGYPPREAFPNLQTMIHLMTAADNDFASDDGKIRGLDRIAQYGITEGHPKFRKQLVTFLRKRGVVMKDYVTSDGVKAKAMDSIVVMPGSQSGLSSIASAYSQERGWDGSVIESGNAGVEGPTYIGALDAFDLHGISYIHMPKDKSGIVDPDALDKLLTKNARKREAQQIKFIYLAPTFQNPTGTTIPLETRERIAELLKKHNVTLIEDDPYGELRYEGEEVPPIQSLAPDHVIYLTTFSKTFIPGSRIGVAVIPPRLEDVKKKFIKVHQSSNLFTSYLTQALTYEYIKKGLYRKDLPRKRAIYKAKRDALYDALTEQGLPLGSKVTKPEGGMFLDIELPEGVDSEELAGLLKSKVDENDESVAVVSLKGFYGDTKKAKSNGIRVCFTTETLERLKFAGEKIRNTIHQMTAMAA